MKTCRLLSAEREKAREFCLTEPGGHRSLIPAGEGPPARSGPPTAALPSPAPPQLGHSAAHSFAPPTKRSLRRDAGFHRSFGRGGKTRRGASRAE